MTMHKKDFRARLQAKPGRENKLRAYGSTSNASNVCAPLWATNGMLMPYTPAIQVTHTAVEYAQYSLPQTNFDYFAYSRRSSPMLSVTAMFTAQNQKEARYLLAVLHWLRAITMNYYGRENGELRGINPPTLLFSAYGPFMYDRVPMLIRNVSFGLDQDVDYISCGDPDWSFKSDNGRDAYDYGMYTDGEFAGTEAGTGSGQIQANEFSHTDVQPENLASLEDKLAQSYVPAVIQPFIELVYAPTPAKMRDEFNLEKFKSGQYTQDSNEGII
ncbi:MAG: hypothetical protein CMA64_11300 [Euryarchaeota archaeon]|nr:hypothetical protein [Euryarchaeota archaeon]